MGHILDTDFEPGDSIVVYSNGSVLFDGDVSEAGEGTKRFCDACDWYLLDPEGDREAVFIGGDY